MSKCYTVSSHSNCCLFTLKGGSQYPICPVGRWGKLPSSQLRGCEAVGAQRLHVCSAEPRWLNKAKSPVDSISSWQIQINSQDVAPARAQDVIDKRCSWSLTSLPKGGAVRLISFKSVTVFSTELLDGREKSCWQILLCGHIKRNQTHLYFTTQRKTLHRVNFFVNLLN